MGAAPMIRKQLYLTPEQDRALKRRARALGVSEAELVRRVLDATLGPEASSRPEPLAELLADARRIAETHRLPDDYRLDRDVLYDRGRQQQ